MTAAIVNFEQNFSEPCEQGADFRREFTWKDSDGVAIDLAGCTMKMQVRKNVNSTVLIELTTENGRITVGADGIFNLFIAADDTELLPAGSYLYDLKMTNEEGAVTRVLQGTFVVVPQITV